MKLWNRKPVKVFVRILAAFLVLLAFGLSGYVWKNHQNRESAERLFAQLQGLRIGETSADEAMKVIREHGGKAAEDYSHMDCGTEASWYRLNEVASPYTYYVYRFQNGVLGNLGVRPWWVRAHVAVEGPRVVCWVYEVTVLRSDGVFLDSSVYSFPPMPPAIKLGEQRPAYFGDSPQPSYSEMGMFYSGAGPGGDGLGVIVTHKATPQELQRAFDVNFNCMTQLRECRRACQLMPSVWRQEAQGGKADANALLDPHCQAVLSAAEAPRTKE